MRTYSELSQLQTYLERFNYLRLNGQVGIATFGFDRYLNQALYRSAQWKKIRDKVIIRDNGCDLGVDDRKIFGRIIIHHMNPIKEEDILNRVEDIFNPDFLICTSIDTHNAIHYGDESLLVKEPEDRRPNDTCLWRI